MDPFHTTSSASPKVTGRGLTRRHVLAGAGATCGALASWAILRRFAGRRPTQSLAILPFVNTTSNAEIEYLSDGLTETLINHLGQIADIRVMSRSAVFANKGSAQDAQSIGRALNVGVVLTGRVTVRGDELTVAAELV